MCVKCAIKLLMHSAGTSKESDETEEEIGPLTQSYFWNLNLGT